MNKTLPNWLSSLADRAMQPVDIAYLACLRIAFGVLLTWLMLDYIWGDIARIRFIDPTFHFSYRWFEWVTPLPGVGMYVLLYVLLVAALCITFGLAYRVAIWTFFAGWTYYFLIDPAYYLNHYYLVGLLAFLLGLMPAHAALSVDAKIRPSLRSATAPVWTLWTIRAQIGIVYFYAGVTKLQPDWLSGDVIRAAVQRWIEMAPVLNSVGEQPVALLFSYTGLLLDLTIFPGLLWHRSRLFYVILAGCFHLMNSILFVIDIFPFMAFALTLSFFDPGWPRALGNRLTSRRNEVQKGHESSTTVLPPERSYILFTIIIVFLSVQTLVPLRHFAYPGDHNWTEEGHHFSWHLMSRAKKGQVAFIATDPESGKDWLFDPRDYLGARQAKWMAIDPQLILQFAHFIGERMADQGFKNVEVRAFSKVSMNGSPSQHFVDPETDLTTIHPWQRTAGWVVPRKRLIAP